MSAMMPVTCPAGFRQRFITDGWRGIERYYGARTDVMMRWLDECGGVERMQAERRAYLSAQREAAQTAIARPPAVRSEERRVR
jgi:hypothetical protein